MATHHRLLSGLIYLGFRHWRTYCLRMLLDLGAASKAGSKHFAICSKSHRRIYDVLLTLSSS
ncbi:hypothetical protein FOTG_18168 [Fusarium oxysporum f. sp. vasinfectum 25433]|uniref:Uncharacterized protein n=1 Tax=Fusarium oxysporum f. sp. vasinfectum 25433 TaxID=1089449 RepID=X0KXH0_FUSOX|nr:hypothetical protein FOTG_18168 [Fusarium oxysporum f. sp. vasinfectum 25433]